MIQKFTFTLFVFIVTAIFSFVFGQGTQAVKPSVITGDVVEVTASTIVVNTQKGKVEANLTNTTEYKRVAADKPSLATAIPALVSDIAVGDRLMITGILAEDGNSLPARAVYLMSKEDITAKNAREAQEWRTRGISGKVVSANTQTNQVVVEVRGMATSTSVTLTPKAGARFLRYAQDSIRFDEAVASSITEVAVGDMLRALGDRSADGTAFAAEQIVTGAFQTIAGTVKSVDAEKNEVVITDLQNNKDVTVMIGQTSVVKRFPTEMAERLAGGQMGGARPVAQGGPPPRAGARPPAQGAGPAGMQRQGGGSIDEMIDRFPNLKVSDLVIGDMIALSSSKNGNTDRIRAIKLLAGVEPFIRMAQMQTGGGRGRGGVQTGFTIPGLDGVDFP